MHGHRAPARGRHRLRHAAPAGRCSRSDACTPRRTWSTARSGRAGGRWADARGGVDAAGEFELVGPDARHATFAPDGDGGFLTPAHLDLDATIDGDAQHLRWGRRSPYFGQTWIFRLGLLREVVGPFVGSTTFHYDGRSRLVRLDHDSGRSVELVWVGRTVARLRASDGRQARFRYDRRGHLVEVRNAVSPETYDVDEQGRIRSITDADGVRMVAMTYDDDGRVVAQISQTGLTTRFGYAAGLRTTLSDAAHTPISVYTHDEQGRVEMYATAGGLRFSRRFDEYGRVVEQHEPDGTSVAHDRAHRRHGCASSSSPRRPVRSSGSRSTSSTASCTTPPSRARRPPRARASSTTATRSTPGGSRSTASWGSPSTWPGSTACRHASSTAMASPTSSRSAPTARSAAYRNALGDVTRFEYSPAGAIAARYLPDGRVVGYERDDAGRLLAMVNPAGERGELTYTPAGRLLSTRDYDGATITLEYDAAGLPHRVVAADGAATDFVFDDEQRVVGRPVRQR